MAVPPQFKKSTLKRRLQKGSPPKKSGNLPPFLAASAAKGAANGDPLPPGKAQSIIKKQANKPKSPPSGKPPMGALQRRLGGAKPDPNAPPGQGGRFAAMTASGVPPGLAAFIGRKKYGNKKFNQFSAPGRK